MTLTKFQKFSYKWFGRIAEKRVSDRLLHDLESVHMEVMRAPDIDRMQRIDKSKVVKTKK